jgi:phage tail-like protein
VTLEAGFQLTVSGSQTNRNYLIPLGRSLIGRDVNNDLIIEDPMVSSRHAQLDCSATECRITDMSRNGTWLNGERLVQHVAIPLNVGDELMLGQHRLRVVRQPGRIEPSPPLPILEAPAVVQQQQAPPPPPPQERIRPYWGQRPPGLSRYSIRLLQYLPEIYHPIKTQTVNSAGADDPINDAPENFMARFLAIFESILLPIEWNIDNFDLFLDTRTAPNDFLPWLASWFGLTFDATWSDDQRRTLLAEAHDIFARRGTRGALSRVLEIYTKSKPEIIDLADDLQPFTFRVRLPVRQAAVKSELIEALIEAHKPAFTTYILQFNG